MAEAEAAPEPLEAHGSSALKRTARWPEFSEYGCFSCHHDLRDQTWRRGPRLAGIAPGSPRWGTWILPDTSELLGQLVAEPDGRAANELLNRVTIAMEKPDSLPQIKAAAHDAAGSLEKCLAGLATNQCDAATVERLIEKIDSPEAWDHVASWDEAAGRYLALVPLYQSWQAQNPGRAQEQQALRKRLDALLERLRFPKGSDGKRLRARPPTPGKAVNNVFPIPPSTDDLAEDPRRYRYLAAMGPVSRRAGLGHRAGRL